MNWLIIGIVVVVILMFYFRLSVISDNLCIAVNNQALIHKELKSALEDIRKHQSSIDYSASSLDYSVSKMADHSMFKNNDMY